MTDAFNTDKKKFCTMIEVQFMVIFEHTFFSALRVCIVFY